MADPLSPDEGVRAALVDRIAQWLHDECTFPDPYVSRSWPLHDADTGRRESGSIVKLVPKDVVEEYRHIVRRMLLGFPALSTPVPEEGLPRGCASAAEPEHLIDAWNSAVDAVERAYELAGLTRRNGLDQTLPKAIERLGQIAGEHAAQLAQINAMLRAGQGDDDGPQIMPDFTEGMSTADMVAACIGLLEQRRDVIEAPAMGSEGYVEAFYQIATLLGVPAQSASPKAVFEEQMLPRLKALVAFTFSTEPGDSAASALPSPLPSQGEPVAELPEDWDDEENVDLRLSARGAWRWQKRRADRLEAALAAAEARADRAKETLNAYLKTRKTDQWADRKDDLSEAIAASHPLKTGRHDLYRQAMMLVGNRHSKYALVDLVNHFLAEEDRARTILKETAHDER